MASFRLIFSWSYYSSAELSDCPFMTLSNVFWVAFSCICFILFITNDFMAPRICYRYFFWASLTAIVFLYLLSRASCSAVIFIEGSGSGGSWTGLNLSVSITSMRSSWPFALARLADYFFLLLFVTEDLLLLGLSASFATSKRHDNKKEGYYRQRWVSIVRRTYSFS